MNWDEYIASDSEVLAGKPTIKGTRISLEFIVGRLADGWSEDEILENYPSLTKQTLQAVYAYMFELVRDTKLYLPGYRTAA